MTMKEVSPVVASSHRLALIVTCWFATLLASVLPLIIWQQFTNNIPSWLTGIQIGGLFLLLLCAFLWAPLKAIRGFLLGLIAILLGWEVLQGLVTGTTVWTSFVRGASVGIFLIGYNLVRLIPGVLMALTLIGSGLGRRELFLRKGDLKAANPLHTLFRAKLAISWISLGIVFILVAGLVLPIYLTITIRPNVGMFERVLINLPIILICAIVNSANEEFEFRAVLLARLTPLLGNRQAIWITTVLFGLQHYYGQPSGLIGVLLAGIAGLFWGLSMIETKGCAWAWVTHFVQDAVIFSFLIMVL